LTESAAHDPGYVVVGRLVAVHGVRGVLKLHSYCDPPERIFRYRPWLLRQDGKIHRAAARRAASPGALLCRLEGADDRDAAAAWVGAEVLVERASLPALRPGEYYWHDLIGLHCVNAEGVSLGVVKRVFATGANDVLVVEDDTRERLIPYTPGQHVQAVALDTRRIVVDWDPDF
jgi:16S rRNA processing protein RimM